MDRDDMWIINHFSELVKEHAGKYVAVVDEEIVAIGDTSVKVETASEQRKPGKTPSVLLIPREEDMACLL
jgi:hypothetical protein